MGSSPPEHTSGAHHDHHHNHDHHDHAHQHHHHNHDHHHHDHDHHDHHHNPAGSSMLDKFLEGEHGCCAGSHESSLSFSQHLFSGAVAGVIEHFAIFPLDTIKTRIQTHAMFEHAKDLSFCRHSHSHSHAHSHSHSHSHAHHTRVNTPGVLQTCKEIISRESPRKLFRGVTALVLGAGPSHAVYFATYEQVRKRLGANEPGYHPLGNAVAGAAATIAGDTILAPMDTIKQRMQVRNSPYRHILHVATKTISEEGVGALFASYRTTLLTNIPFCALQFSTYHTLKELTGADRTQHGSTESLVLFWLCGGTAGATAGGLTTPMDVVRTTLQTQGLVGRVGKDLRFSGMLHAAREIATRDGFRGFWRGVVPRIAIHFPGSAICWSSYEFCKRCFESGSWAFLG